MEGKNELSEERNTMIFLALCFRVYAVLLGHVSRYRILRRRKGVENSIGEYPSQYWGSNGCYFTGCKSPSSAVMALTNRVQ